MSLATSNYAKKVRVTPRTKNCIPSLSNLTKIINVLKIGSRIPSDQEIRQASLEGGYLRKRIGIIGRWPSDWSYLRIA